MLQYKFKSNILSKIMKQTSSPCKSYYQKRQRQSKYESISYEKRNELIELVIEQNLSIYQSSRYLGINNATAKAIVRKYRNTGRIFKKVNEKPNSKHVKQPQKQDHTQDEQIIVNNEIQLTYNEFVQPQQQPINVFFIPYYFYSY